MISEFFFFLAGKISSFFFGVIGIPPPHYPLYLNYRIHLMIFRGIYRFLLLIRHFYATVSHYIIKGSHIAICICVKYVKNNCIRVNLYTRQSVYDLFIK